ncbi:MAG: NUDIX domain-containing protein [bacterium]|nr:NUDIX domain-containing protein [bacterium]
MKNIMKYCPVCRSPKLTADRKAFHCPACGWTYFHNIAAAAGGFLIYRDKLLLIRRAAEPAKGKLDLPGGFIDHNESAEEALRREIREELYLRIRNIIYFRSYPNIYLYKRIKYFTCDFFYLVPLSGLPVRFNRKEVQEVCLLKPGEIDLKSLAFSSAKKAVQDFRRYYKIFLSRHKIRFPA